MPTYEFRCGACEQQFEVFQSMSDPDPEQCANCGVGGQLEKLLFPVAVHYKGSGFYSTDYSGKKASASSGSDGNSGASGGESTGSTSEASPSSAVSDSGSSSSSSSSD